MRRFMMHLLVATVAFIVGLAAANLLGQLFGRDKSPRRFGGVRVERRVTREAPPSRGYDCPYSRPSGELPVPVPAPNALPELPPPPTGATLKGQRIVILGADGTRQVIDPPAVQVR